MRHDRESQADKCARLVHEGAQSQKALMPRGIQELAYESASDTSSSKAVGYDE